MSKLPARTGWLWVSEGFALFKKRPAELSTLFITYMFLMLAFNVVPLIGPLLPLLLAPVFSMAFMQACVEVEQGRRVYPTLLLTGFRSPALRTLLVLGSLYLAAAMLSVAASGLVDGGVLWRVMGGKLAPDAAEARASNMWLAILFAACVYTPAAMALWYAAPLAAWKNMGVGKAAFYSFFAVRHASRAFLAYGLAWIAIGVLLPLLASALLVVTLGKTLSVMILMPVSIVLTVVMYCSFYPTYTHLFGKPGAPPEPAADSVA